MPMLIESSTYSENPNALPRVYLRREFAITDDLSALNIATQADFDFHRRLVLSRIEDAPLVRC